MAVFKGSRYEAVPLFEPDAEGRPVFKGIGPRPLAESEPVLEHAIAVRDRLDGLGHNYYREARRWYRLAEANVATIFPEDLLHTYEPQSENGAERLTETLLVPRREEETR